MMAFRSAILWMTCGVLFALASLTRAGDDAADKKTIKAIVDEIHLATSLYAWIEPPLKMGALPKFSAKTLKDYGLDKQSAAEERKRYVSNRPQYAKDYPLRAAIFDAVEGMEKTRALDNNAKPRVLDPAGGPPLTIRTSLSRDLLTPKGKVAFFKSQEALGVTLFKLDQLLEQMKAAEQERSKETSKRWQANFDSALVAVASDLIFLFEYSFVLGQIRADNLPELGAADAGWKIVVQRRIGIPEAKAKNLQKDRLKRLDKMQTEYAETPWAHFAELESRRDLGMQWAPKAK